MTDAEAEAQAAAMDALEERIAVRIVDKLAALAGGFPSAEDIALIRDHIHPNGVAFQNGKRAGRAEALKEMRSALEVMDADEVLEFLSKEL